MPLVPASPAGVSPVTQAAVLLAALPRLAALGLPHPTASAVLHATGVSRSRAYEIKQRLESALDELVRPSGRPPAPRLDPAPQSIASELLDYVYRHPGCVSRAASRRRYSDGFRCFVLELLERHREVALEAIADVIHVPLGTLRDWLRGGRIDVEASSEQAPEPPDARGPRIETVLEQWKRWDGTFTGFCDHLQLHCRVPFGRTLIARILEAHGVRLRPRRRGRSPDEQALRGAFETFFPHAQWVGDGSQIKSRVAIPIEVNGELFVFNLELDVDAYSGAFVGADVSAVEDSDAVIRTFRDAIAATGTRPLALLLDNKPSNHTDQVVDALGDTLLIPATPHRPENKAHCEGGFGLLKPTLEGLVLHGDSMQTLAASYLRNLVTAAGRAINHRPRADRGGRSRVDLLNDTPTPEEVEQARKALAERLRKQELARRTRAARQDPAVRAAIANAYERLGLDDPQGCILTATARYPLDPVVEGIAIFEGRHRAGTLPDGADARYLLGIVHNIAEEREAWEIALALWDARVAAQDDIAGRLQRQRGQVADRHLDPEDLLEAYVDRALQTESRIERFFWFTAAADVVNEQADVDHRRFFRLAARRIAATYAVPKRQRLADTRFLAAKILPLD